MENEGITNDIRTAFVVYLTCTDRPMNELLDPRKKDLEQIFKKEFSGMTTVPVTLKDLVTSRENLIAFLKKELTDQERKFVRTTRDAAIQNNMRIEVPFDFNPKKGDYIIEIKFERRGRYFTREWTNKVSQDFSL